jgi:NitT/TauT family transport system permease protein
LDKIKTGGVKRFFIGYTALIVFFLIWEFFPRLGLVNDLFIPPLSKVLVTIFELLKSGELFIHIGASLRRVVIGFGLAAVIAIPLGFLLGGFFKVLNQIFDKLFQVFAQINPFSVFPIFILFFGIGETTKVAIIFWVCIWPILFSTISGVRNIDPRLIKSARTMGITKVSLFFKVILPGSAATIFQGIRLGAGSAFLMLIAAEMIGSQSGLGWMVLNSQRNYTIPRLYAAAVTIAVLGILLTNGISAIERKARKGSQELPTI